MLFTVFSDFIIGLLVRGIYVEELCFTLMIQTHKLNSDMSCDHGANLEETRGQTVFFSEAEGPDCKEVNSEQNEKQRTQEFLVQRGKLIRKSVKQQRNIMKSFPRAAHPSSHIIPSNH